MESREEEEVVRRWREEREGLGLGFERRGMGIGMIEGGERFVAVGPKKKRGRRMMIGGVARDVVEIVEEDEEEEGGDGIPVTAGRKRKGRG